MRPAGPPLEAAAAPVGAAAGDLAPGPRGLKRGLRDRVRTVRLRLDEAIITETPPLHSCYGRAGQQVSVPITGNRAKRILHGTINVGSGDGLRLSTRAWVQETHQVFLGMIRSPGRGWHLVLFEDRGSPHTAEESVRLAPTRGIEVRWLPRATPEWNAMDQLWRRTKGAVLASRPTQSIDVSADRVCDYILGLSPQERLRKAGVLSGNFWLAD